MGHVIPRYTPKAIAAIFADSSRLRRWLEVELLVVEARAAAGEIDRGIPERLRSRVKVNPERIAELEAEQGHDVAAFVSAVQETAGDDGAVIHFGLTSSDIVDTALSTQIRDAWLIIEADCLEFEKLLAEKAVEDRLTPMPGRTHGMHAEALTWGVKLANHYDEIKRSRARLAGAAVEAAVGHISGPIGTHTSVSPKVEEWVCEKLHLQVAPAATQVVARDRQAALISAMALLGGALERLATTIRLLQQSQIGEVEEPFAKHQKGSSAMPHKHNPILSERICGLARLLRGYSVTMMESIALWHERDISHSSADRVVIPDAFAVIDYMLKLSHRVIQGLTVDRQKMSRDLEHLGKINCSPRVLEALINAGWSRETAYRHVQDLCKRALDGEGSFEKMARADQKIVEALTEPEIEHCFDLSGYLARIDETFKRLGLPLDAKPNDGGDGINRDIPVEAGIGGGIV